jgi:hypothetical protein
MQEAQGWARQLRRLSRLPLGTMIELIPFQVKYVLTTLLFGMAGFAQLRREVQKARIDSIGKGN